MEKKRFEYIDAMRGFTMLLVVYGHVNLFSYHVDWGMYAKALGTFRIPLFFFISGFVLYKVSRIWNTSTLMDFLKGKFMVQIIPTLFFFVLYTKMFTGGGSFFEKLCDPYKSGYWFTISLLEFFVIYGVTSWMAQKLKIKDTWLFALVIPTICFVVFYSRYIPEKISGLLQTTHLGNFVFFYFGILVRKYFQLFLDITNKGIWMSLIIGIWFFNVLFIDDNTLGGCPHFVGLLLRVVNGILGLTLCFCFFRRYEQTFTRETRIGRWLQYLGRRTLDVYLLHYFFLPRHLDMVGDFFVKNPNPTLELFCTLAISVMVVSLCLITSSVMRLSTWMSRYLFGVKPKVYPH